MCIAAGLVPWIVVAAQALVLLVRDLQKKGVEGSQGGWHAFLEHKNEGMTKDPSRLPWQTLAEFIGTLPKEETAKVR